MAYRHKDPCADNAAEDEPIFSLRAHDMLAPAMVREWAARAQAAGSPAEKVGDAIKTAEAMEAWQAANGSKVPD